MRVCFPIAICSVNFCHCFGLVIHRPCAGGEETARSRNASNGCSDDRDPSPCSVPDNVTSQAASRGLSMLARSTSVAVYGADIGTELELLVWDCSQQKRLEFLHIPKNAGTTIENVGRSSNIQWGRFHMNGQVKMRDGSNCSEWHIPPAFMPSPNPYEDDDVEIFCVTRDPWERIVSEYMYRLEHVEWLKGHKHSVLDGPECTREGLNKFVVGTCAEMQEKPFAYDCHMLPQWDYIQDESGRVWCKHVLPIEQLTNTFNGIMAEHQLSVRLEPHKKDNSAASVCPDIDSRKPSELLDASAQTALRALWLQDFLHLGDSLSGEGPAVPLLEVQELNSSFHTMYATLHPFEGKAA